ncbi:Basic-leucine zipper [Gracilaria domingensis]|nr:Basic-leucine zipper [Gracilaria domingensis]
MSAAASADVQTSEAMHMSVNPMAVPVSMPSVSMAPVAMPNVSIPNVSMSLPAAMPPNMPAVQAVPDQQHPLVKDDEAVLARQNDETPLVEVAEAMMAANEVFNRVKSEKIAEQALCSIRNDQAQYEGLAKEIVGKAIKQKERERANRASAAASRAKVLRYQTELESRLNRMEAERNAYRKELSELRNAHHIDTGRKMSPDETKQLSKLQDWIRKMEAANPQFVRSIIAQQEMDKLLGEDNLGERLELEDKMDEEHAAKRRRTAL